MTKNSNVYAICCWPEVAGDVISGENVKSTESESSVYALLNFEAVSISSFPENRNRPFA